jgi:hypothetical protein
VLLSEGDVVPADAMILEAAALLVDASTRPPRPAWAQFAAANMTVSNRLLIGTG